MSKYQLGRGGEPVDSGEENKGSNERRERERGEGYMERKENEEAEISSKKEIEEAGKRGNQTKLKWERVLKVCSKEKQGGWRENRNDLQCITYLEALPL